MPAHAAEQRLKVQSFNCVVQLSENNYEACSLSGENHLLDSDSQHNTEQTSRHRTPDFFVRRCKE